MDFENLLQRRVDVGDATPAALQPPDLLSDALLERPTRVRDQAAELRAFQDLSKLVVSNPSAAVQRFLDLAVDLCSAGSAGWSRLGRNATGEQVFWWDALAGQLGSHTGGTTPRNFSPCGLCLDAGKTVLVARPARVFTYFNDVDVAIVEALIVPVYDTSGAALGTIWVVHHDTKRFDANDAVVMEELAVQLVLALKTINDARRHDEEIASKLALIKDTDHRVKNTIQSIASLLTLQARGCKAPEARAALEEAKSRLEVFSRVHELLHGNGDGERAVDVAAVIETIATSMRSIFSDRVALQVQADHVILPSRLAVPLALLINESITNAYKHAYPNGQSGEIVVRLARSADGALNVAIQDDGVGLSTGAREGALGLRLIRSFASQLGGELGVQSSSGVTIRLTIPAGVALPAAAAQG